MMLIWRKLQADPQGNPIMPPESACNVKQTINDYFFVPNTQPPAPKAGWNTLVQNGGTSASSQFLSKPRPEQSYG